MCVGAHVDVATGDDVAVYVYVDVVVGVGVAVGDAVCAG